VNPGAASAALLLAVLVSGCEAPDGLGERYALSGRVTLDGRPLPTGVVVFIPLSGGPPTQGVLADGEYSIPVAEGPTAGTYRVEIFSLKGADGKAPEGDEGGATGQPKDRVPPAYNVNSTLRVVIGEGGGLAFDFSLKSSPEGPP